MFIIINIFVFRNFLEKVKSDKKTNKEQEEKEESDLGFDDPFFTTSVSVSVLICKQNIL